MGLKRTMVSPIDHKPVEGRGVLISGGWCRTGLRWKIPFHLLDAIFYNSEGKMTVNFKDSREAVLLLEKVWL
jgi:hypothetical protein